MEKKMWKAQPKGKGENKPSISILSILKILLAMYMVTGILLLILSAMLYRMQLSESVVSMGIVLIYVLSGFFGRFFKRENHEAEAVPVGNGHGGMLFPDSDGRVHYIPAGN